MQSKPTFFRFIRAIIGLLVVVGFIAYVFALLMKVIPQENRDTINIAGGALGVLATQVVQYYFGSSKDKSDGDQAAIDAAVANK